MHVDTRRKPLDSNRLYADGDRISAFARIIRQSENRPGFKEMVMLSRKRDEPGMTLARRNPN